LEEVLIGGDTCELKDGSKTAQEDEEWQIAEKYRKKPVEQRKKEREVDRSSYCSRHYFTTRNLQNYPAFIVAPSCPLHQ